MYVYLKGGHVFFPDIVTKVYYSTKCFNTIEL